MKTHTITTYSFSELSEQAKENAISELRDINTMHNWWEFTYSDAAEIGLKITGFALDRNRHATGDFTLSAVEVAQNILNNHVEKCGTYKLAVSFLANHGPIFAEYMDEDSEKYESAELEEELMELEDEFLSDLLEEYSCMLQKECEYLESDEAIIQTIEANEYEFTENGNIY